MASGLASIIGGLAQGITDFGKSAADMFGGAATNNALTVGLDALLNKKSLGQASADARQRQNDYRKWLYDAKTDKDAAAKGLGTALNGAQAVMDFVPGIGQSAPVNALQGAIGGLADEFKFNGENYDLGRAAGRAAIGSGANMAAGGLGKALANSGSKVLSNGVLRGAAAGGLSGAISQGGNAAIEGGSADQILQSAAQGAKFGALMGAGTGGVQSLAGALKNARARNNAPALDDKMEIMAEMAPERMSDSARAAEIKRLRAERRKIGPEKALYDGTLDEAQSARWSELYRQEEALKNGYDSYDEYFNTLRSSDYMDEKTLANVLKGMTEPQAPEYVEAGSHTPVFDPEMSSLASSMNRTVSGDSFVPDDFYEHMNWYGGGDTQPYIESEQALRKIQGDPNAKITVYRATVGDKLNPSDWVTLSPTYAKMHLDNALRNQPGAKIIKETVRARDLRWPGDDINEFGYYPITNGDIARGKALLDNVDIMAERAAPGQLGLFDQTATKTPETGYNQLGLFDTPVQPKTIDTADVNPYAPVNGQVTQTMRDRATDIMTNYKNGLPENELYNRIDPETMPTSGIDVIARQADGLKPKARKEYITKALFGNKNIEDATMEELFDVYYAGAPQRRASMEAKIQQVRNSNYYSPELKDTIIEGTRKNFVKNVKTTINKASEATNSRNGFTGAADAAFSERLGIAPGNTNKRQLRHDSEKTTYGRYRPDAKEISITESFSNPEDAISTMAHERLHSFQHEADQGAGRYAEDVKNAYKDLQKDLQPLLHSRGRIRKDHARNLDYYESRIEQESRMLQDYLDQKGYTDSKRRGRGEYGEEINPAFDRFFDKLRELSKKGVALPAILATLGLGGYATQNQEEDENNNGQQI